ncbi:MAG: tRNA pseudouridine(13) synthase TruD [Candidatus Micrarchaeota archaeon]|nr:tRNA pseudouridine(13) synthase TruD [Candidatus Micrarchaeota archaeon]
MRYLSESKGTGGAIKRSPQDFIVKEITKRGRIIEPDRVYTAEELGETEDKEGKFVTFVLQKSEWNTIQALQTVAKRLGRGVKSIGYAGMKDRNASTTQLASIFGVDEKAVLGVVTKDIKINGAWRSTEGVGMGELLGNSFEITINECDPTNIGKIAEELDSKMLNYFDAQRFGNRLNNAKVGLHIMKGELEEAVLEFLTATTNENNKQAVEARKTLLEERDFARALEYFPGYLKAERTMLYALSGEGTDYARAIRSIPRGISILFIHAVEALIFNYETEIMAKEHSFEQARLFCGHDLYGFPDMNSVSSEKKEIPVSTLIGYETDERAIDDYQNEILENLGINRESFKIKSMPELSMRGAHRPIITPIKDFGYEAGENSLKVRFSLPSGSYATILIGEITKSDPLDLSLVAPELKI